LKKLINHPRYVGIFVGTVVLTGWLCIKMVPPLSVAVIVASALFGLVIVTILSRSGVIREKRNIRWRSALFVSAGSAIFSGWIAGGRNTVLHIAAGLSLAFPIIYAFAKIGCYRFGCCSWGDKLSIEGNRVSLQSLEAILSFLLFLCILLYLLYGGKEYQASIFFMVGHGIQRVFSKICRQKSLINILCSFDASILIIVGSTMLWFL